MNEPQLERIQLRFLLVLKEMKNLENENVLLEP